MSFQNSSVEVMIKRKDGCEDLDFPRYMSDGASGMDLYAAVEKEGVILEPGKVALIPTGIHIALPPGYEAQVRPRSGLALKNGVTVLNAPGTVDSDYRNEVGVILINLGEEPFCVERGMRVAQMVISSTCRASLKEVENLEKTERGLGGFGSTGL